MRMPRESLVCPDLEVLDHDFALVQVYPPVECVFIELPDVTMRYQETSRHGGGIDLYDVGRADHACAGEEGDKDSHCDPFDSHLDSPPSVLAQVGFASSSVRPAAAIIWARTSWLPARAVCCTAGKSSCIAQRSAKRGMQTRRGRLHCSDPSLIGGRRSRAAPSRT